jgi:rod shape-determining protein MreD
VRVVRVLVIGLAGLILLGVGVPADLLLVGAVLEGLFGGALPGGVVGAACGLAQDLLAGTYPGLHAVIKGLVGMGSGAVRRHFFQENPLLPALAVFAATLAEGAGCGLAQALVTWQRSPWPPVFLLQEALINTLAGLCLFWWLYRPRRP